MSRAAHLDALADLAPAFDELGAEWCLIKWPDDDRDHGDLDVLVADDGKAVELAAVRQGFRYDYDRDPYRRKYVRGDVELDIHLEAAWVGVRYLPARWVVETADSREVGGVAVPVPSPEADLLIWAAHDMRSNAIPEEDVDHCAGLLESASLYTCRAMAAFNGWLPQFDRFVGLVEELADDQAAEYPYRVPTGESAKLKLRKVAATYRLRGWAAARSELWSVVRFDIPHLVLP